jgi:hypothetical protein
MPDQGEIASLPSAARLTDMIPVPWLCVTCLTTGLPFREGVPAFNLSKIINGVIHVTRWLLKYAMNVPIGLVSPLIDTGHRYSD